LLFSAGILLSDVSADWLIMNSWRLLFPNIRTFRGPRFQELVKKVRFWLNEVILVIVIKEDIILVLSTRLLLLSRLLF
jgi:hypothetical protein